MGNKPIKKPIANNVQVETMETLTSSMKGKLVKVTEGQGLHINS